MNIRENQTVILTVGNCERRGIVLPFPKGSHQLQVKLDDGTVVSAKRRAMRLADKALAIEPTIRTNKATGQVELVVPVSAQKDVEPLVQKFGILDEACEGLPKDTQAAMVCKYMAYDRAKYLLSKGYTLTMSNMLSVLADEASPDMKRLFEAACAKAMAKHAQEQDRVSKDWTTEITARMDKWRGDTSYTLSNLE